VTITTIALNLMKEKNNTNIMITQGMIIILFKKTFLLKLCWKENKDAQNFMLKPSAVSRWIKAVLFKDKIFSISDFPKHKSRLIFFPFFLFDTFFFILCLHIFHLLLI